MPSQRKAANAAVAVDEPTEEEQSLALSATLKKFHATRTAYARRGFSRAMPLARLFALQQRLPRWINA
jgi:hypothetical protein